LPPELGRSYRISTVAVGTSSSSCEIRRPRSPSAQYVIHRVEAGAGARESGVVRDRSQYYIDAPVAQLQTLGIFRAFTSRDELRAAVLAYIAR
jgi:hypothetical protein